MGQTLHSHYPQSDWQCHRPNRLPRCWPHSHTGDFRRAAPFIDAEFAPDGEMVGDEQGVFQREVIYPHEIEDAAAAGVLDRVLVVEDDIVELVSAAGVGSVAGDDVPQVGDAAELAEMLVV